MEMKILLHKHDFEQFDYYQQQHMHCNLQLFKVPFFGECWQQNQSFLLYNNDKSEMQY